MQVLFSYHLTRPLNWTVLAALLVAPGCGDSESTWVGKTYLLDISPLSWSEPPNIGGDIGGFVPQFLFKVEAGTGDELSVLAATAGGGVQDPCNPTTRLTTSASAYPNSTLSVATLPARIVNPDGPITVNATMHALQLSNVLPGGVTDDGKVVATADIAELYPLFTLIQNPTKASVCAELDSFGAPCEACGFRNEASCVTVTAVDLDSVITSAAVVPIAAGDVPSSCSSN